MTSPGDKPGSSAASASLNISTETRRDNHEYSVGANYWPIDEVVLKVDYTYIVSDGANDKTVNFGIGYYF